jgi:hypothetical protein
MAIKVTVFISDSGGVVVEYFDSTNPKTYSKTFLSGSSVGDSLKTWVTTVRKFILGLV